ncbi:MAG: hypothetical protein R3Y24_14550 [Eubacteriales bacterium]
MPNPALAKILSKIVIDVAVDEKNSFNDYPCPGNHPATTYSLYLIYSHQSAVNDSGFFYAR